MSASHAARAVPGSAKETLVDALYRGADLHPEQLAIRGPEGKHTWRELRERSNQLANRLRTSGAGPETVVGVLIERGVNLIVAVHGILKAGAAFLLLNPDDPPARRQQLLASSRVSKLVCCCTHAPAWPGLEILCLEDLQDASKDDPPYRPQPDDLAYVIYTSGSTGVPKGVAMPHAGLANRIRWMQAAYPLTRADILHQKTVCTFDPCIWELLWWVLPGASVVTLPPRQEQDPRAIVRQVSTTGITVLYFVPTLLSMFLDWIEHRTPELPSLRRVFVSGEKLTADLVSRFYRCMPAGVDLVNLYGPTEAAIDVTHHICRRDPPYIDVPIGQAIDGVTLHILDQGLQPVLGEAVGELCIEGVCLARGYHLQPEPTARSFVMLPGSERRVYRTGDLAWRCAETGDLHYVGRIDGQLKLRGQRMEPGEIEHAIRRLPHILGAVVLAVGEGLDRALHGLIAASPEISPEAVWSHLEVTLPRQLIPARLLFVDALPVLPNGKLDRSEAAALLKALQDRCEDRRTQSIHLPLSQAQIALWFEAQARPEAAVAFSNPSALRIRGRLDVSVLAEAVARVVARHPILGIAVVSGSDGPEGVPCRGRPSLVVQPPPEARSSAELLTELGRHAAVPFKLELENPLSRFSLFPLAPADHLLLLNFHHLIVDGWSKVIILEELLTLYSSLRRGAESSLPPPTRPWVEHAAWQRARRATAEHAADLQWWAASLTPLPPPLAFPGGPPSSAVGSRIRELRLSAAVTDGLRSVSRRSRSPLSAVLLALHCVLLYRITRQREFVVCVPSAGRSHRDFDRTVGLLVRLLPLRITIDPSAPFLSMAEACRSRLLEALRHQEVGFEEIVRAAQVPHDRRRSSLMQTTFQYDNLPLPELTVDGLTLEPLVLDTGASQVPLSVSIRPERDDLVATIEVDTTQLDPTLAAALDKEFRALCEAISREPERTVRALSAASAEDQASIMRWNNTGAGQQTGSIESLISAQLDTRGAAVAIESEGEKTTYAELALAVEALAALFMEAGLRSGERAAAVLDGGRMAIACALASWRLGATWVPLDPARDLDHLMAACCPRLLIHQGQMNQGIRLPAWPALLTQRPGKPLPVAQGEADSLILFTSGTTGVPKGVRLGHLSLLTLTQSFLESYGVTERDALLPVTSPYAASYAGEAFPILAAGGRLVLLQAAQAADPVALQDAIVDHGVTILSTVPSVVALLDAQPRPLGALRLVICGGEPLWHQDVRRLRRGVQVVNSYGLTEGGICSTWHALAPTGPPAGRIPIGRPILGTRCYVLDEELYPVPVGVEGELFLAGDGLAKGFLDVQSESGRFLKQVADETRLLRTGDRARWLPSGELECAGRIDRQVQIRGYRVEPAEVERAIASHPRVSEAQVGVRSRVGEQVLLAWFVAAGRPPASEELRSWVAGRLPRPMIPAAFLPVKRLPVQPGDADLAELVAASVPAQIEPPQTETERAVHALWCELLELPAIDVMTNFFDAGGHSLLLAKVQTRLRGDFGRSITIVELLELPTIRQLAARIDESQRAAELREEELRGAQQRRAILSFSQLAQRGSGKR